jgi:hypothetical protein
MYRLLFVALAGALLAQPAPASAQADENPAELAADEAVAAPAQGSTLYSRQVFRYPRAGRPDPFRSLLQSTDLGVRLEDLSLRGVMHNAEGGRSVAVLWDEGAKRRIVGRVGDRIGGITIISITPRRVDLQIEELGVVRRESLQLNTQPQTGIGS